MIASTLNIELELFNFLKSAFRAERGDACLTGFWGYGFFLFPLAIGIITN